MQMSARAVKTRERASWNALLQPFMSLTLQYAPTRSWPQLRDAESCGAIVPLSSEASMCALYCNELLMRLFALDDAHPEVYGHYRQVLCDLSAVPNLPMDTCSTARTALADILRQFEWSLLVELGSACDLSCDQYGVAIACGRFYRLHDSGLQPVEFKVDQDFSGADLIAMSAQQWSDCPSAAKRLLRVLLAPLLGSQTLNSRELWRERSALRASVKESSS